MHIISFLLASFVALSEASPLTGPKHDSSADVSHLLHRHRAVRKLSGKHQARRSTVQGLISRDQANGGCPRPTGLPFGQAQIASIVPDDMKKCYFITDCGESSLFRIDSSPQWEDFASGESEIVQYIQDFYNQNQILPNGAQGIKDATDNNFVQAASLLIGHGAFGCNLYAPNTCVPPTGGQDDCNRFGAAGYNFLNSIANLYAMASEITGAITQAAITVEVDAIVQSFSIPNQQPPQLNAKQFFQVVLGFLGGFGGAIGEWANDVKTITTFSTAHQVSHVNGTHISRNEPARVLAATPVKPSNADPASPKPTSSSSASSNPLSSFNITTTSDKLKTYANTAVNILTGVKGALPSSPNSTVPSLNNFLSNMVNTTLSGLEAFAESMFFNGQYVFPSGQTWNLKLQDGSVTPSPLMLWDDLMINGSLLVSFTAPLVGPAGLANQLAKTMTSQMIQYVWQNGDGGSGVVPFVTWDDAPCGQVQSVYLGNAIGPDRMQADVTKAQTTIDGRCYYLLGAMAATCKSQTPAKRLVGPPISSGEPFPCCAAKLLNGGTTAVLNGTQFAGLTVDDLIKSAVASWSHNGSKNGGSPPSPADISGAFPSGVASLGSSIIPVCDYRNLKAPGTGCPDLTAHPNCPLIT